jgi:hypothetical protein
MVMQDYEITPWSFIHRFIKKSGCVSAAIVYNND